MSSTPPNKFFPSRVRVLVIGGGIHGVGVLHDLVSRGWQDVALVEKQTIGSGTSSRSTKLIHGGLRYLKRIRDFGLVREALRERRLLIDLAGDIVRPIELIYPILRKGGMSAFMVNAGLTLYDVLAGRFGIKKHRKVSFEQVRQLAPMLADAPFRTFYSFWDGQTDDLALVNRIATSAEALGGQIFEGVTVERLVSTEDGWDVTVRNANGTTEQISARYIVNAAGPWANKLLEDSQISPTHRAINDKGIHLVFSDRGLKSGLFFESPDDGRIFFMLPWMGKTLLGTTEALYTGDLNQVHAEEDDISYLLERVNRYMRIPFKKSDIERTFAGLRWLAMEKGHDVSSMTRSHVIGERENRRGLILTIYGGKLTTYRTLSAEIGDRIFSHFGDFKPSRTAEKAMWTADPTRRPVPGVMDRFTV